MVGLEKRLATIHNALQVWGLLECKGFKPQLGLKVGGRALKCRRSLKLPTKAQRNERWRPEEYFQIAVFKTPPQGNSPKEAPEQPQNKRSGFLEPFRGDRKFHITWFHSTQCMWQWPWRSQVLSRVINEELMLGHIKTSSLTVPQRVAGTVAWFRLQESSLKVQTPVLTVPTPEPAWHLSYLLGNCWMLLRGERKVGWTRHQP